MVAVTRFTDPIAVDTWDTWFRWREGGALRDVTIDATWWRVAEAFSTVEGALAPLWAHRYVDAFSRWRLLPDERLLQSAGTGATISDFDRPAAVLNVAAFVAASSTLRKRFDRDRFADTAAMAVRLLDGALGLHGSSQPSAGLRIGVIGLADALRLLGLPYASVEAQLQARDIATALAEGTLRGAIDLAGERGVLDPHPDRHRLETRWRARGVPDWLIQEGLRCGVRYSEVTAIEPHPRLASLANNVNDALDPSPALAGNESRLDAEACRAAQLELRAAMQPWIDAPIDYPLVEATPCAAKGAADLQTVG